MRINKDETVEKLAMILQGIKAMMENIQENVDKISEGKHTKLTTKGERDAAMSAFLFCEKNLQQLVVETMGDSVLNFLEDMLDDDTLYFKTAKKDGKPAVSACVLSTRDGSDKKFEDLPQHIQLEIIDDMKKAIAEQIDVPIASVVQISKKEAKEIEDSQQAARQLEHVFNIAANKTH
jgi:Asp-tRNA(Asn)/Glu-tRNA(Gln) amidotransferase A subunit family amidase